MEDDTSGTKFDSQTIGFTTATGLAAESSQAPWIDSDTWYEIEANLYFNARTGVTIKSLPDGLLPDGTRRRSAATTGEWAVPFQRPPPRLPAELAPNQSPITDMLWPDVEAWGDGGLLFTAPHCVNLARDGRPEHMPEDFTAHLARAWAAKTRGTSVCWGERARAWCTAYECPLPGARDPNYLTAEESEANAWVRALSVLENGMFHVDVHGKADRPGEADADVGVGALRAAHGDKAADTVADAVASSLEAELSRRGFAVDARPRLQGCWRSVPRRSLTQASVQLGFVPIQLELGYRLRCALGRNLTLCAALASAILTCVPACVALVAERQLRNSHHDGDDAHSADPGAPATL